MELDTRRNLEMGRGNRWRAVISRVRKDIRSGAGLSYDHVRTESDPEAVLAPENIGH
jgi:hypothetical protein